MKAVVKKIGYSSKIDQFFLPRQIEMSRTVIQVGILLKPFLPQLQTTFIKSLNDTSLGVRQKAAWALGLLTVLHTRVDSLFTELKNGIKNNEDNAIRYQLFLSYVQNVEKLQFDFVICSTRPAEVLLKQTKKVLNKYSNFSK